MKSEVEWWAGFGDEIEPPAVPVQAPAVRSVKPVPAPFKIDEEAERYIAKLCNDAGISLVNNGFPLDPELHKHISYLYSLKSHVNMHLARKNMGIVDQMKTPVMEAICNLQEILLEEAIRRNIL